MGNTGSAIAQCVVSVALVVAGAAVAASSFGAASVLAGGLISAGVSGATTTITNCVQGKPASWKEWGKSTAIGAVTGMVGGALCSGVGGLAKGLAEGVKMAAWKALAIKGAGIVAGSTISSVTCNAITNQWNGRKPFEGVGVAAAVGAAGGLFACAGAASFHSLKHSATSWLAHPVTRHSIGVGIDTASSVVGGVIGAGLTGADIEQAALIGLATGAAVGTFTTAVRCSSKKYIRRKQRVELERRAVVEGVRHVDGVDFVLEQTTNRDEPRGHRDLDHIDRHHSQLKGRFNEAGHETVTDSSRFYDLGTANQVREMALPQAARQINGVMLEKAPLLDTINQGEVMALQARWKALKTQNAPLNEIAAAKLDARNAQAALSVKQQRANVVKLNAQLTKLFKSSKATPAQIKDKKGRLNAAQQSFDQVVGVYLGQVEVNIPTSRGCGYGYRKDNAVTREFNIRGATSYFRGAGSSDGSIVWREVTSYPNSVKPSCGQSWFAGDRMNRRQVARNVLTQRHAAQRSNRDEEVEERFVGA